MNVPLVRRLEASHSYGLLLGVILVSLTFQASAPDTRWSRLVVEALVGQLYLVTVVAVIVGNLAPRRRD
jgi:hypothetical protein